MQLLLCDQSSFINISLIVHWNELKNVKCFLNILIFLSLFDFSTTVSTSLINLIKFELLSKFLKRLLLFDFNFHELYHSIEDSIEVVIYDIKTLKNIIKQTAWINKSTSLFIELKINSAAEIKQTHSLFTLALKEWEYHEI